MNPFKGRHFQRRAVRWYCKYGIRYRELQEMLAERGVNVDHSTIYRWVQCYAPEMEKRLRWYWRNPPDLCPWLVDETYVKVCGRWAYLYRAATAWAVLSIFIFHHGVTAKQSTGSWVKSSTT